MYNRLIVKVIGIFLLLIGHHSIHSNQSETLNPSQVLCAWDFHDVIVKKQHWSMIKAICTMMWYATNKLELIKTAFNPYFWYDIISLRHTCSDVPDEILDIITQRYLALMCHKNEITNLVNLHEPIPETIALIKALKHQGYRHCIASNIGERSYTIMLKRFPEIFTLFDGIYIAYTTNKNGTPYAKRAKPHHDYYEGLRAYLVDLGYSQDMPIVFIDDKAVNVHAAQAANVGIQGIQFYSAQQVQKDFEKQGIYITNAALSAQVI